MQLINFEFALDENFAPSQATKKWGLFTHKSKHIYAGIHLPGFFQTTGFPYQLMGLLIIFGLEIAAILWSHQEGSSIQIIIGLALLDIVLAIAGHWWQGDITLYKNMIVFEKGRLKQQLERKLFFRKLIQSFFYLLIILSAFIKFGFFYVVYMSFDATALLILFFYLLGGILHVACTGHTLFTIIFWYNIQRERTQYINSSGKRYTFDPEEAFQQEIRLSEVKKLTPVKAGLHEIIELDGKYYFQTYGILNDRQLGNMIALQDTDDMRQVIAKEGVRHQHMIYLMQPNNLK